MGGELGNRERKGTGARAAARIRAFGRAGAISRARAVSRARTLRGATTLLLAFAGFSLASPAGALADTCRWAEREVAELGAHNAERSLLCLVNLHRARHDVAPLTHEPKLRAAARAHSTDMLERGYFDHVSPEGVTPNDRAHAAGYPHGVGENIVMMGFGATPMALFLLWEQSPGHNSNMLDSHGITTATTGMGIGIRGRAVAATQKFGTVSEGATDTAVDLLETSRCVELVAQRWALADRARALRTRAQRIKRRAGNVRPARRQALRRELRRTVRRFVNTRDRMREVRAAASEACDSSSFEAVG